MNQGFHPQRQAFVQHYRIDVLDAALLRMPAVGIVDGRDPMWQTTPAAMDKELVTDSLVYRYNLDASPDGLRGSEGTFSLCSFHYVDALTRAGRLFDARMAFEKMLTYANHVGLYSEEIALTGSRSATSRRPSPTWRSSTPRSRLMPPSTRPRRPSEVIGARCSGCSGTATHRGARAARPASGVPVEYGVGHRRAGAGAATCPEPEAVQPIADEYAASAVE
jgi:hypothetical protein